MINLRCPYCRNTFLHPVEKSTITTECPACGGQMEIQKQLENMEVLPPSAPPKERSRYGDWWLSGDTVMSMGFHTPTALHLPSTNEVELTFPNGTKRRLSYDDYMEQKYDEFLRDKGV